MEHLAELIDYVKTLPIGKVSYEQGQGLMALLAEHWHLLEGSDDNSMADYKLDRYENLEVVSPTVIEFDIERHGAAAQGSVYAEIQGWMIDLTEGTACCGQAGRRLTGVRDKPLKVEPLAKEIVQQIVDLDKSSNYLKWKSDDIVKVKIAELIPFTNMQTTTSRRRRFRDKLEEILLPLGWGTMKVYNTYERLP
jgi:hypothetical protein